ncbi:MULTISPECIES: DUF411 domain-containing protein [Oceanibaculum]|jgi:hypothetical protein|uniref:DUF411 domain-containing protein n=1 Tax=Oceanibaculum TaxID=659693 RepID=UPI000A3C5309|nr:MULTISPECIES: DUF411 domain-containing protein [Oceanibaculum]MCH2393079.1 DUF411 domain-containing protein [Oceanibaculum sp.]
MHRIIVAALAAAFLGAGVYFTNVSFTVAQEATLYKNPQCGCCEAYADYLRDNGFTVTVKPTHELVAMSREAGIPDDFQGCHLAFIDDYVVSGHVPVATVNRLLSEHPDIKGVTLPGMPMGSPGMSGAKTEPFTIYAVGDGKPSVYAVE